MSLHTSYNRVALPVAVAALGAAGAATAFWLAAARRERHHAERLHRTLVDLLLNALSAGDRSTARHSRRVANLTDVLARAVGIDPRQHSTLRLAALLHDMGKIEDQFFDVVHSRERLSPEQRTKMKHHPSESAHILEPLERFHPGIMDIVSSHHECWNGEGYPCGMSESQIPLAARIIAVADVFDAMTQPRSYRDALPVETALEELRDGAGTRFDPEVVEQAQSPQVWSRWLQIAEQGRREEEQHGEANAIPQHSEATPA